MRVLIGSATFEQLARGMSTRQCWRARWSACVDAIQLRELNSSTAGATLQNAVATSRVGGVERVALYRSSSKPYTYTMAIAGRWTTDVWAPLAGFMANVAVRYRW